MRTSARVLVIEDDPASLELVCYLLRSFGHIPLESQDGAEGWRLAVLSTPDLILCDVQLPGLSGLEVAARLKSDARTRHIPLVAVTALAMVGDRERVLAAGFDDYIPKPIQPELFLHKLTALLSFMPGSPQPEED